MLGADEFSRGAAQELVKVRSQFVQSQKLASLLALRRSEMPTVLGLASQVDS